MAKLIVKKDISGVTWGYELLNGNGECIMMGDGYESKQEIYETLEAERVALNAAFADIDGLQFDPTD